MAHFNPHDLTLHGNTQPDLSDPQVARLALNLLMQHQQQHNQALMQQQSIHEQLLALGVPLESIPSQMVEPTNQRPYTIPTTPYETSRGAPSPNFPFVDALSIPSSARHHHHPPSHRNPPGFSLNSPYPWGGSSPPEVRSTFRMPNYGTESLPDLSLEHAFPPISRSISHDANIDEVTEPVRPPPPRNRRAQTLPGPTTEPASSSSRPESTTAQTSSSSWLPEELAGRKPASPPATTAEEKRRRNTEASTRFRLKKKLKTVNMQRVVADLSGRAAELEKEAEELRRENGWLKEIVALKGGSASSSESPPYIGEPPYASGS